MCDSFIPLSLLQKIHYEIIEYQQIQARNMIFGRNHLKSGKTLKGIFDQEVLTFPLNTNSLVLSQMKPKLIEVSQNLINDDKLYLQVCMTHLLI